MIVARGTYKNDDESQDELIILGLSDLNIKRLLSGKPIMVERKVHGDGIPDGWRIMLMTGKDEETMKAQFQKVGLIKEDTHIIEDKNLGRADDR